MRILGIILALAVMAGLLVAIVVSAPEPEPEPPAVSEPAAYQHPNLNATLWVQTAAEYSGSALQAYVTARVMLEIALEDPSWTAALEQEAAGGYESLPPAIILDVDETVLDNGPNQARQILDATPFNRQAWHAWVREEQAHAVPGALEFTRYAAERGVAVFYVTNRRHEVEEATRNNLAAIGFPLDPERDTIYTRDERSDWGGDKGTRRATVGAEYRILLLIGDNLGDFLSGIDGTVAERDALVQQHRELWGRRWIVLPNPQYGSWEGSLTGYQYGLPPDELGRIKVGALDARR